MIFGWRFGIRRQRLNSNARIASTAPFACGAVLSWAESTQRPPLSWKKAPKEPKSICCGFTSFGISFPSLLRIQHGSLIVAYAALWCAFAPQAPCFILLAPSYQEFRLARVDRSMDKGF